MDSGNGHRGIEVAVRAAILALLAERDAGSSICPSEAARRVDSENWRDLMETTRGVAAGLAGEGRIAVIQGGEPIDPAAARGPIRLRLAD